MGDYTDPGFAATSAMNDFLYKQDAMRRQAAQDQRLAAHQAIQDELAQQALNEKRIENQAKMDERQRTQTQKDVENMAPGDIPDGDLVDRAKRYHVPLKLAAPAMQPPPVPAGLAAEGETNVEPTSLTPAPPAEPTEGVPPALSPAGLGPGEYSGSPAYQRVERERQRMLEAASALPEGSGERKAAEYAANTMSEMNPKGLNMPAGAFKPTGANGETIPVVRIGRNGTVETIGNVPKGAHFQNEPAPIRITVPRNEEGATAKDIQGAREKAFAEVQKLAQPDIDHIKKMNLATKMLKENNREADALLAPLIIGATISGMGSGFRMTQAEINKVEGATSMWGHLRQMLQNWKPEDGTRAFTPTQLEFMKKLLVAGRDAAMKNLKHYNDLKDEIRTGKTYDAINKARTALGKMTDEDMLENPEDINAQGGPTMSVQDWLDVASGKKPMPGKK